MKNKNYLLTKQKSLYDCVLVLVFLMVCSIAGAQDIVTMKDGSIMTCQVLEVGDNQITFKQSGSSETMVLSVKDIDFITYANGEKDTFGKKMSDEKLEPKVLESSISVADSKIGNHNRSDIKELNFFEILYINSLKENDRGIWGIGQRQVIEWASEGWGLDWQMYTNAFLRRKFEDFTIITSFGGDYSASLTDNGRVWLMFPLMANFIPYYEYDEEGKKSDKIKCGFGGTFIPSLILRADKISFRLGFLAGYNTQVKKVRIEFFVSIGF